MKFCSLGLRSYIFLTTLVFTLKMDAISSLDDKAKATYPELFLKSFPNPNPEDNTINAPFALRNLLLAASIVAKRETKTELETMLYGEKLETILELTATRNTEPKMRLFVNENMDISECVKKRFSDIIEYVDFSNNKGKNRMNAYAKEKTQGTVSNINTNSFDEKTSYVTLVHDEYLDLLWKKPFQEVLPAGSRIDGVSTSRPVLRLDDEFLYGNLTDLDAEAIEVPLENDAKILLLRPYDVDNINENFQSLKEKLLSVDIREISQRLSNRKLSLYFPVLDLVKMERSTLPKVAKDLNIVLPFEAEANFDKLHPCGEDTYIYSINTHSRFNTNLTGMRIASVTELNVRLTNALQMVTISGEDDANDDDEDEAKVLESYQDSSTLDSDLPSFLLKRYIFAVIQNDYIQFMGTMVKFHNDPKPTLM